MKFAVLISGVYKNATEPIVELMKWLRSHEGYEFDVYIHAWWDKSYVGKRYRYDHTSIVEDDPTEGILEKIKPKKLKLEPQAAVDFNGLPYVCGANGTPLQRELAYFAILSQAESLKRCYSLIDHPEEYDVILRMRGDLFLDDDINYRIPFTKEQIKERRIFFTEGTFFTGWPLGDWIYMGNPSAMGDLIMNQAEAFRSVCMLRGECPHVHIWYPHICYFLGIQVVMWPIRMRITRCSTNRAGHLLLDKENQEINVNPYFWHLMDFERLKK